MIGGVDTIVEGHVDWEDIDLLLRVLCAGWSGGIYETSDGTVVMPLRRTLGRTDLGKESSFVYRDEASKASWDAHGLTESNGAAMISVILEENCITLVSGEPDTEAGSLVTSIRDALRHHRHAFRHHHVTRPPDLQPESQG